MAGDDDAETPVVLNRDFFLLKNSNSAVAPDAATLQARMVQGAAL